jgi:hypothetical protein
MAEREKKGLGEWFMAFQKAEAVALIGLAMITGSAALGVAAIIDSTTGVIVGAELEKRKKKKTM